jgi:hypothetical protein
MVVTTAAANAKGGKKMAKTLNVWHYNMSAPWPTDPVEMAKLSEMLFAAIDNALKTGKLLEFGYFPDGTSGYGIGSGETKDQFGRLSDFFPWVISEVHEMIPHETGKEVLRGAIKARAEAMAAMKR